MAFLSQSDFVCHNFQNTPGLDIMITGLETEMADAFQNPSTGALIVAAGLSFRMHNFKPLLLLGDKTIIETVIDKLIGAGIEKIVLVTGYRAAEIEELLSGRQLKIVRNENYALTQMFESVKIGLWELSGSCSRFFFLPADLPLFRIHTLTSMCATINREGAGVVIPAYREQHGHPTLISEKETGNILGHDGSGGLKGALTALSCRKYELNIPDPGILLDVDTPQDYLRLKQYQSSMDCPSSEVCQGILEWFGTPGSVADHCQAVARTALELTDALARKGHILNRPLVESAALLHDVARLEKDHARYGSSWLKQMGLSSVAEIVAAHMDVPEEAIEKLDERAIVYAADKLIIGDSRVSLEEKFEQAMARFGQDRIAAAAILERKDKTIRILEKISAINAICRE